MGVSRIFSTELMQHSHLVLLTTSPGVGGVPKGVWLMPVPLSPAFVSQYRWFASWSPFCIPWFSSLINQNRTRSKKVKISFQKILLWSRKTYCTTIRLNTSPKVSGFTIFYSTWKSITNNSFFHHTSAVSRLKYTATILKQKISSQHVLYFDWLELSMFSKIVRILKWFAVFDVVKKWS